MYRGDKDTGIWVLVVSPVLDSFLRGRPRAGGQWAMGWETITQVSKLLTTLRFWFLRGSHFLFLKTAATHYFIIFSILLWTFRHPTLPHQGHEVERMYGSSNCSDYIAKRRHLAAFFAPTLSRLKAFGAAVLEREGEMVQRILIRYRTTSSNKLVFFYELVTDINIWLNTWSQWSWADLICSIIHTVKYKTNDVSYWFTAKRNILVLNMERFCRRQMVTLR